MNRLLCGLVVFATAGGLGACGGDPFENQYGQVDKLVATPSILYLDEGSTEGVLVEAFNPLGQQAAAEFKVVNFGPGVTAAFDPTFQLVTGGEPINTRARLLVTGVAGAVTSVTVSAGGKTLTIPVGVVPPALDATFNPATANPNEPIVVTPLGGLKFDASATAATSAGPGIVLSVASDGSALTFLPWPGSSGTVDFTGILVGGATFDLTSIGTITVGTTVTPQTGTDALATAPLLTAPQGGLYDAGPYGYGYSVFGFTFPAKVYRLDLTAETTFTVNLNFNSVEDLGIYFADAAGADLGIFDGDAGLGGEVETATVTLGPGTFYINILNFDPTDPPFFQLQIVGG